MRPVGEIRSSGPNLASDARLRDEVKKLREGELGL